MSTKTTIPEHYRQWAKQEAEREYPDRALDLGSWRGGGTQLRFHNERIAYEAALLRLWPLVDAMQRIAVVMPEVMPDDQHAVVLGRVIATSKEALSSLNLPKVNSNGEDQE